MAKKTLNIVESAYRAVMEEQDDTILWLLAAMQGAGAEHTVVLRGNAVNYALAGQGVPGLTMYVVAEDLADRGIERGELVPGVQLLSRTALPGLFAEYALVAHW